MLPRFVPQDGALVNPSASDHGQALAGGTPNLVLDMDERAGHLDYGAAAADCVDTVVRHIGWAGVLRRHQDAVGGSGAELGATAGQLGHAMPVDVRHAGAHEQAEVLIEGACRRDPADVSSWAAALPVGAEVVVVRVNGQEVSQPAAPRLRGAGVAARFLRGGIERWKAGGGPLQPKPEHDGAAPRGRPQRPGAPGSAGSGPTVDAARSTGWPLTKMRSPTTSISMRP